MDWSNERYVRLYLRDTPEWALLSWEARGFFCLLLRAVDRAGLLDMGRSGHKALAALLRVPLEVVDRAVPELLEDGCVRIQDEQLLIPNYIDAQEAKQSDRVRQQECRARRRDLAMGPSVTIRDAASRNVTDRHERSRAVTSGHERSLQPSLAEPSLAVEDLPCAARTGDTHPPPVYEPADPDVPSEQATQNADVAPGTAIAAPPAPPPAPAPKKRQRGSQAPTPATEELRAAWNELTTDPLPRWRESGAHVGLALAALRRRPLEQWREVFRLANQSAFLRGENDRGWRADIAFILRAGGTNGEPAQRILDGAFRSSGAAGAMGRQRTGRAEYSTEWDGKPF